MLPEGFAASGVACGLKASGGTDFGLLVSDRGAAAVGIFTTNRVRAAPVVLSQRHLRKGRARAIVANAGNANACTGRQGMLDARATARMVAKALSCRTDEVLVASTGIIGVPLDMAAVQRGVPDAAGALSGRGLPALAEAIMTTDTRPKTASAALGDATVVGVAKGSGMIAPEMATMLAFVATDAPVERGVLAEALQRAAPVTFGAISVDGCRSTNDCVLVMANGAAGGEAIEVGSAAAEGFAEALNDVCARLARAIVEDGEGATKVVRIAVEGATNEREARRAARSLADSVLLRCAMHGADPNWGRAMAALGTAGIPLDPATISVWIGGQKLAERGAPGPGDPTKARAALADREVEVRVDLGRGTAGTVVLTNDLSAEYIRINAEYTT